MNQMAAAGRWDDMPSVITDEMVETFATIGTYGQIIGKIKERFGGYATQISFSIPTDNPDEEERLKEKILEIQNI